MVYKQSLSFIKSILREKPDGFYDLVHKDFNIEDIPEIPGVYIVLSNKEKFPYPTHKSRVIYIGMSKNIRSRIKFHIKSFNHLKSLPKSHRKYYWFYSRYNYMVTFGCQIVYFTTRGKQTAKNLESTLIEDFYSRYHAIPIGNGAFSFKSMK